MARVFLLLILVGMALVLGTSPSALAQVEPPPIPKLESGLITFDLADAREGTEVNFSIAGIGVIKTTQTVANPPGKGGFSYSAKVPGDDPNTVAKDGANERDLLTVWVGDFGEVTVNDDGDPLIWTSGGIERVADIDVPKSSVLVLNFNASPSQPRVDATFRVSGTVSNLGTGETEGGATVTARWGDGDSDSTTTASNGTFSINHSYASEGDVTLEVDARKPDFVNHKGTKAVTVLPKAMGVGGGGSGGAANEPPVANAGSDQTANEGDTVFFDGSGSTDPEEGPLTFSWAFGDGGTDTGATPSYVYVDNGTFTATLTVTDDAENTATDTSEITVANVAPTVVAGDDVAALIGDPTVTISFTFDDPGINDGPWTYTIAWTDESDSGSASDQSSPISASHTYAEKAAEYTVSVTVTDKDGDSRSDSLIATVRAVNAPPVAVASVSPTDGDESRTTFSFDASGSTDPDGNPTIVRYLWDLGDNTTATGIVVNKRYRDNGTYTVTLAVTDDFAISSSDQVTVVVRNVVPTVSFRTPQQTRIEGFEVSVTVNFTDPGADTHSGVINWGDDTTSAFSSVTSPLRDTHRYVDNGTFVAVASITDDDGGTGTAQAQMIITNVRPSVVAGPDQAELQGVSNQINASFSDPGVADTHVAQINWGDGTVQAGVVNEEDGSGTVTGSHVYEVPGIYAVNVTVTDDDGDAGSDTLTIVILAPVVLVEGIEITSLTVSSQQTVAGQPVIATLTIKNIGETTLAEAEVDVLVNGERERALLFEDLAPQQSASQSFPIIRIVAGTFAIQGGPFVIIFSIPDADIRLVDAEVQPLVVAVGDSVRFTAELENQGGALGSKTFVLNRDGVRVRGWEVTLTVGEVFTLFHEEVLEETGQHTIELLAPDSLFSAEVETLAPQLVTEVPTEHDISPDAVAYSRSGKRLEINRDRKISLEKTNSVRLVIPIGLELGEELDRFLDPVSNITITGTDFEIPVRDPESGRTTIRLTGTLLTPLIGDGEQASAVAETVDMSSEEREQDLTADDPRVGLVTTIVDAVLSEVPSGSRLSMLVKKEPNAEDRLGLEEAARRLSHPVTGDPLTVGEVATTVVIDTNLSNTADVELVTFYIAFGEEWLNFFLEDPNSIPVMGHVSGEGAEKDFEFLGALCFEPGEELPERIPDIEHANRFLCEVVSPRGFSVFSLLALVPRSASLQVTDLTITPTVVQPGEPVVISAEVTNSGEGRGTLSPILKIDGQAVTSRDITVASGEVGTVRFFVIREELGTYQVEVEGRQASFEVARALDPALLQVLNVVADPLQVEPGEPVTITVSVLNNGDQDGSTEVELFINEVLNKVQSATVLAQDVREVVFVFVPETEGIFQARSGDRTARFDAAFPKAPASFRLSDLQVSPKEIPPNEQVTVTVLVSNIGDLAGDFTAELQVQGAVVDQQEVALTGNSSLPVTFTLSREVPRLYSVRIGDLTDSFEVLVPPFVTIQTLSVPDEVIEGDIVTIEVDIQNAFDRPASRILVVTLDQQEVARRDVTLSAAEVRTETFQFPTPEVGDHQVAIEQLVETLSVIPLFASSDLTLSAKEIVAGATITITVQVTNNGTETTEHIVDLIIDGDSVESKTVNVPGNDSRTVEFNRAFPESGTFEIEVDGLIDTVIVSAPAKPAQLVVGLGDLTVEPESVTPGGTVTIAVRVENVGDETGSGLLTVAVDDAEVFRDEVTLGGGQAKTFTFEHVEPDIGTHNVTAAVDDVVVRELQFEVSEKGSPIIIILVAGILGVLAMALAIWFFYFRRRRA